MVTRYLRQAVAFTAIFSLLVTDLAWAAGPIADPTAPIGFRPTVQNAPNGVPTVNITQPSAGGVSRNRYDSFNVPSQGVILNNSTAAGVSVLAGSLAANPNLTLSAQVILNEVTGGGLSSLAGPTEVFGPAASVIIANPNGISVSGASFINAPRVSLITGTPSADGRVFTIDGGLLAVTGSGLDGTGISQLDLVGRRVSLDSGVTGAGTLTVIGGAVEYDHVSGQATALASPSAQGGSWAIDASALGAMNAGQVRLIGSEAGVGVRALGGMAAGAGGITVTSSGQIVLGGTVGATDAVTVSAGSDADLSARTTAASLTASAGGTLVHSGTSTLTGGATLSGSTVTASGGIIAGGDVAINSTGETSLSGTVASDGAARVTTKSLSQSSGGALTAGGPIEVTATDAITNAGAIDSGAGLRIAAASLSNSGRVGASGAVEVTTAGGLDNSGGQVRGSDVTLRSGGSLTNVSGTVGGTGQLTATAAATDNRQGFLRTSGGNVTVSTTGTFDNRRGVISGRDLALDAASLDNSGGEAIASGLLRATTNTGAMVNQGGTLFAHGTATLTSASGIVNTAQGLIGAEGALALTALGAIDNSGGTIVGNDQVALTSAGQLVQGGSLTAAAALNTIAASFINRGYTASADTVTVTAGTVSAESGQITANRDVTVTATGMLDNRARISSGTDVRLSAATLSNGTTGRVEANNAATLSATGTLGNSGLVAANGAVSASAGGVLFNSKGTLLAGSTMTLTAGTALTNEAGLIQSGGDLALTAGTRIDNRRSPYTSIGTGNGGYREQETSDAASISAGGNLRLTAPIVVNQASLLAAGGDLTVTATSFSNQVNSLTTLTRVGYQVCKKKFWGGKKCWTDYSNSWSYAQTPSLVYAGGTFEVGAASVVNTGTIQAHKVNAVANTMTNGLVDWTVKTMPAASPASRIDLTQYSSLPTGTAGLFDISRDPASRYVVTTSVNVANQVNQDYLLTQLGSIADPNPRFFADPFAEAEMLKRAALAQTGQRFFVPEVKTDDEQRRALYDNAAAYAASRTDLHLGAALTDTQIAALAKPILWYVKNDDGVLTPTIYLPKVAQEQLTHLEGGRILADDATLKVAGQLHNTGYVTVANALTVNAGSILNEQRTARDTAAYVVTSKGKGSLHEVTRNVLQAGGEISAGTLRLTATDAITSSGGRISATSTLEMLAGGDITVAAARVENHERVNAGKAGWTLDSVVNHAALVAAGLDLTVTAGGDITVAGSKLQGGKDVALRAGGDVTLAAAVDEYSSHSWNKKSRSSSEFTREETTNRGAEVSSSGGDVSVQGHNNVTVQASRVAAADDVTLTAETGQVALLSGTDSRKRASAKARCGRRRGTGATAAPASR
jgi:filamentous hemagglutinin